MNMRGRNRLGASLAVFAIFGSAVALAQPLSPPTPQELALVKEAARQSVIMTDTQFATWLAQGDRRRTLNSGKLDGWNDDTHSKVLWDAIEEGCTEALKAGHGPGLEPRDKRLYCGFTFAVKISKAEEVLPPLAPKEGQRKPTP
jgi:hypothetical protein